MYKNLQPLDIREISNCWLTFFNLKLGSSVKMEQPPHDKTNKMTCAQQKLRSAWASTQSDQSLLCTQWVAKDPRFLHADSEDSDQTGRMPKLIWVFAGCTCHFVGFVMHRLIYCLVFRIFLSLMDVDGKNPSNREDLKLYWHHLQIEGIDPSDVYEEFLIKLGILTPEVSKLEVHIIFSLVLVCF